MKTKFFIMILLVAIVVSILTGSIYTYNSFENNGSSLDLSYDTPLEQVYEGRIISSQHIKTQPQSTNPVFVMCPRGYFTTGYAKTEQVNDEHIFVGNRELIKDGLYGWQFVFENHNDSPDEFVAYVDCSIIENPKPLDFFHDTNLELRNTEKTRSESEKLNIRNSLMSDLVNSEENMRMISNYVTKFQNGEQFVDFFIVGLKPQYLIDEPVEFDIVEWGYGESCSEIRIIFFDKYFSHERQVLINSIQKNCQDVKLEPFVNVYDFEDVAEIKFGYHWEFPRESEYLVGIQNDLLDYEQIVGNFKIYSKQE